jgi:hypothetical protein
VVVGQEGKSPWEVGGMKTLSHYSRHKGKSKARHLFS